MLLTRKRLNPGRIAFSRAVAVAVVVFFSLPGCESSTWNDDVAGGPETHAQPTSQVLRLRIYSHPYQTVDWSKDQRLLAQHHDHVGSRAEGIMAYDAAGYDVFSLMDYSGNAQLSYAMRQRIWPPADWVPGWVMSRLSNIKLFLPNAEEVGIAGEPMKHATSPFLTSYIEGAPKRDPSSPNQPLPPNEYRSVEDLFALVRSLGGTPCLAHPWNYNFIDFQLGDSYCIEVYNAIADMQKEKGMAYYVAADRNAAVIAMWDQVLEHNQRVFGIAVNDHVGPTSPPGTASDRVRDSGKILVLAKEATLASYKEAFETGRFFAIRDYGRTKNRYPVINRIDVEDTYAFVDTAGAVRWITDGHIIATGPILPYSLLVPMSRYVRAEIVGDDDTIVYTQAFAVRPVGDVDGDYAISRHDLALCRQPSTEVDGIEREKACAAALRAGYEWNSLVPE